MGARRHGRFDGRHQTGVWLEITTLLIPGLNDSDAEIDAMTRWVAGQLGPDVPVHFTAFHPDFKMRDRPDAELALADPDAPVLVVHAAALLAVLGPVGDAHTAVPTHSSTDVLNGLLRHEARYWQRSQAARGLQLEPSVTRRAAAAAILIGADDEDSANRLLSVIADLGDPARRATAARWLHDLYPLPPAPA